MSELRFVNNEDFGGWTDAPKRTLPQLGYRPALLEQVTHIINTTPPYSHTHRRAWGLFRALRDHDAVDLADSPVFWQAARAVMPRRHWLRCALWFTVVP